MLKLPIYAPDQAFLDNKIGASDYIVNLFPSADGYRSISDFVRISTNKISGRVIGSISTLLADDGESNFTIIGTTKGLFSVALNKDSTGESFVDISRDEGYNLGYDETWDFVVYGNYIIACNHNYPIQILDLRDKSKLKFKDLTEAPRGNKVAVWGNHLVIVGVYNKNTGLRDEVAWSGLNNPHDWNFTSQASDADEQQFFDGGIVLNATSSKTPLIFARNKIYRGSYIPSSALIFTFVDISDRISLKGINSVIEIDDAVYFYSDKGFYRIDASNNITNIGESVVNNYVNTNFSSESLINMVVIKDYSGPRIFWGISKTYNSGYYDYILVYDYALNKWSTINRAVQYFINYTTFGYTLESLDKVSDLDHLPLSLDSAYWQKHSRVIGAIDPEGYLITMTGKQMESSIRTGVISDDNNGFITMTAASLDTITDSYNVDLLYTDTKRYNFNYKKYFKKYKIPVSRYRDEAIFNIRAKYIKIQYNIDASNDQYTVYNFKFKTINNGFM